MTVSMCGCCPLDAFVLTTTNSPLARPLKEALRIILSDSCVYWDNITAPPSSPLGRYQRNDLVASRRPDATMHLSTATFIPATATFTAPELTRAAALPLLDTLISASKGDSQLQRWSSLIGIVTAIIGNILISFALNIQRYAHIRLHDEQSQRREKSRHAAKGSHGDYGTTSTNGHPNGEEGDEQEDGVLQSSFHSGNSQSTAFSERDSDQESSYLKSPYWWGGIVLMTVGEAGNFLAYGFAPASIVSPLGVVALISNCVIAPIMLKERFRLRDFWGVVVAVAGAVTVVLSAKQEEKKLGPHEILDAVTTTAFEVYMGVTIFLIAILIWASPRYGSNTILVDLGLVGLFGKYFSSPLRSGTDYK
jgi:hypothetical protein